MYLMLTMTTSSFIHNKKNSLLFFLTPISLAMFPCIGAEAVYIYRGALSEDFRSSEPWPKGPLAAKALPTNQELIAL